MLIEKITNLSETRPRLSLAALTLASAAAMYWLAGVSDPLSSVVLGFLSLGIAHGVWTGIGNTRAWVLSYIRGEPVDTSPVIYWVDRLIGAGVIIALAVRYIPDLEARYGAILAGIFVLWHLLDSWSPYPKAHIPRGAWRE